VHRVRDGGESYPIDSQDTLSVDQNWACSAAFSPDGATIALGSPHALAVYRASDGNLLARLPSPIVSRAVAFSPDGAFIATSGPELWRASDRTRLWSTASDTREPPTDELVPAYDGVAFLPDGSGMLVSHCRYPFPGLDNQMRMIDVRCAPPQLLRASDGKLLREYPTALARRPALSPDGAWLVAGDTLVNVGTGAAQSLGIGATLSVFLDQNTIAAATNDGDLTVMCLQ
jgi:WD40 repeat protein